MKQLIRIGAFLFVFLIALSCETRRTANQTDNESDNEMAEEANQERFDEQDKKQDAEFVAEQVSENYAEIQMAKLAAQKSNNPEVKQVAEMLEKGHSSNLEELKNLANQKAISVPSSPDDKAQRKLENLREEDNMADFNKEWLETMADAHDKRINDFEDQLDKTEDPDLRSWINETLPELREHRDRVKSLQEKFNEDAG